MRRIASDAVGALVTAAALPALAEALLRELPVPVPVPVLVPVGGAGQGEGAGAGGRVAFPWFSHNGLHGALLQVQTESNTPARH